MMGDEDLSINSGWENDENDAGFEELKNLEEVVATNGLEAEVDEEWVPFEILDSGRPRAPSLGFTLFPKAISRIVADFLSDSQDLPLTHILLNQQPINLCLSQDIDPNLGSCWHMGLLPSECRQEAFDIKVDKHFSIAEYQDCRSFLSQTTQIYCPVVVDILVVKLSDASCTFIDVQNAIRELRKHLKSVKHVVISLGKHAACCFSLKDLLGRATGESSTEDHQQALLQIFDDLSTCLEENYALTPFQLYDFYFKSQVQPKSEVHLSRFVISLNELENHILFEQVAHETQFKKIMWVNDSKTYDDFKKIDRDTTHWCHAMRFDASALRFREMGQLGNRLSTAFDYRSNHHMERLEIRYKGPDARSLFPLELFQLIRSPKVPFQVSSLVELVLDADIVLHLNQLNSGSFPNLQHLSIASQRVTGHLDSHRVPHLSTLRLSIVARRDQVVDPVDNVIQERIVSMLSSGLPWQLAAAPGCSGLSLASYHSVTTNPQEDAKEDAPHRKPHIDELLLVVFEARSVVVWKSQLKGDVPLQALNDNDTLLMWMPERVKKITAVSSLVNSVQIEFDEDIPGHTRILESLTCHNFHVLVSGTVLPHLKSFKVKRGGLMMDGAFSQLETLSLEETICGRAYNLDAPLLQSFSSCYTALASHLTLNLQLLPKLSFLKICVRSSASLSRPKITHIDPDLGLSRIQHVVFEGRMFSAPYFKKRQVNRVSHLALAEEASKMPHVFNNTEWLCDTLSLHVLANTDFGNSCESEDLLHVQTPLRRVTTLTVMSNECPVLLDSEMPHLTELTVPSLASLGPHLKCPALKYIFFTKKMSKSEKKKCVDRATYEAIGARPKLVCFSINGEQHWMTYNVPLNESQGLPGVGPS